LSGQVSEAAKKKNKPDEFFNYLAYNGIKNQKASELEKIKKKEELASCTFTPNIYSKSPRSQGNTNPKKFQELSNIRKDTKTYEIRREQLEMRNCTFKPNIDRKSD